MTASKQKGTGGETELLRFLNLYNGFKLVRNPPSALSDLSQDGDKGRYLRILATRPDRGRWLVTMDVQDFAEMVAFQSQHSSIRYMMDVEVKRYKRFSLHSIFEKKFGSVTKRDKDRKDQT